MRYTVRLVQGKTILNVYHSNDLLKVIQKERELRRIHGMDNVWICDNFEEILAG